MSNPTPSGATKCCRKCGGNKHSTRDFYANRAVCKRCYNGHAPEVPVEPLPARLRWPSVEAFDADLELPAPAPEPLVFDVTDVVATEEKLPPVEEHRLKIKVRDLAAQVKSLTQDLSNASLMADLLREAREQADLVAPIMPRERASGVMEGTVQVLASDWHIEEEVRPEQVAGRNRYNLEISAARMTRFFEATRWGINFNRQAFKIRDMILWLGGDIITGHLHDDNIEGNLLSPTEAIAYAYQSIVAGIRHLLDDPELERIVIPCCDGNHGRLTKKMRSATRTQQSIEILLYKMLADHFKSEPRIQFIIATSSHLYYDVYGRTIRYTHGDTTKYGGGVGGIIIPIRKAIARWQSVRHAHLSVMGHYHQHISLDDLICNGSLIGYNSYALDIGAQLEAPVQDMTVLEPRRWKSISIPMWVSETCDDQVQSR